MPNSNSHLSITRESYAHSIRRWRTLHLWSAGAGNRVKTPWIGGAERSMDRLIRQQEKTRMRASNEIRDEGRGLSFDGLGDKWMGSSVGNIMRFSIAGGRAHQIQSTKWIASDVKMLPSILPHWFR